MRIIIFFFEGVTGSTPPYHRRCRIIHNNNIINNEHRKNNIYQQSQFCASVLVWDDQHTKMDALGATYNGSSTSIPFFHPCAFLCPFPPSL